MVRHPVALVLGLVVTASETAGQDVGATVRRPDPPCMHPLWGPCDDEEHHEASQAKQAAASAGEPEASKRSKSGEADAAGASVPVVQSPAAPNLPGLPRQGNNKPLTGDCPHPLYNDCNSQQSGEVIGAEVIGSEVIGAEAAAQATEPLAAAVLPRRLVGNSADTPTIMV
eukprot:TRINITY_DN14912_c0_g1_i1.p1 TRINITY_DN14912_c0_g1~~TRINITY_DN14912_c0_g1_i1.p1  ORF type:complete len:170 (+),score=28.78 TRINITY_DN14912_c0_g1_i1:89-598(+)